MSPPYPLTIALEHPQLGDHQGPLLLTQPVGWDETVWIEARDLQHARTLRRRLLRRARNDGAHQRTVGVMVVLKVHIAPSAITALRDITKSDVWLHDSLHYVGTAAGLAGLIADIGHADVADGVNLRLALDESTDVIAGIAADVLPRLREIGITDDENATAAMVEYVRRKRSRTKLDIPGL